MSPEQIKLNRASLTPTGVSASRDGVASLPPELLREASVRLGWAGMIYAGGYTLAHWVPFFVNVSTHPELKIGNPENIIATVSILLWFGLFLLSRYSSLSAQQLLDFGLVFAVFGSLGISLNEFWNGFPARLSLRD